MQNKKGNVTVIAIIIVIVAITASALGYLFANKSQTPTPQVAITQPISITQPTTPPVDETVLWQTYSNTQLGFEVKYPKDWKTMSPGMDFKGISLSKDGNKSIFSVIYYNSVSVMSSSSTSITLKSFDDLKKDPQYKDIKDITFLGDKAFSATVTNPNIGLVENEIFVSKDNAVYEISYDNNDAIDISKQILATFKFINAQSTDETASWQTYSNIKYGFNFNYPKNWTVKEIAGGDMPHEASFLVSSNVDSDLGFSVTLIKSISSPKKWYNDDDDVEDNTADKIITKQLTINGFSAYFVSKDVAKSYVDFSYAISNNNGMIALVRFREKGDWSDAQNKYISSYDTYLSAFDSLANSIKFTK